MSISIKRTHDFPSEQGSPKAIKTNPDFALFSHLPPDCLGEVLSFLPFKEMVSLQLTSRQFPRNFEYLESLNLSKKKISEPGFIGLIQRCPKLLHLDLRKSEITRAAFLSIAQYCKNLKTLDLSDLDSEQAKKADLITVMEACPDLEEINLHSCNYKADNFQFVNNNTLMTLANRCHNLRKLNISFCPAIGYKGLLYLIQNCRELTSLEIDNALTINDPFLSKIANRGIMKHFSLNSQFFELVLASENESLDPPRSMNQVTSEGVIDLLQRCPIETLKIPNTAIDATIIPAMRDSTLLTVDLRNSPSLLPGDIQEIRTIFSQETSPGLFSRPSQNKE